ncbi:hypothetical protein [Halalkalicoccus jeotgali]|uniref:Uncharacterized protein n=1 Tax=Halalkalicoccus jeotgali (strain DSM 18796 / CECT 7217 / JCM 14584 / KCTC 4019 / B3) TaxID=795797 RepID=D8JC16_HALJB|nr:hypothetical protein [Halalkalicoccus jeotgali]ADJ16923.1 hypothetical protein HacjB3_17903 [Halalkalicoccus jeotgali B3]ELY38640.1 hypothetical protein C497_06859 [Halalkalicoccus jeotgali B3]
MPEQSALQQSQQQFWAPEQRTQILDYVNKRAHDAIDEKGSMLTVKHEIALSSPSSHSLECVHPKFPL